MSHAVCIFRTLFYSWNFYIYSRDYNIYNIMEKTKNGRFLKVCCSTFISQTVRSILEFLELRSLEIWWETNRIRKHIDIQNPRGNRLDCLGHSLRFPKTKFQKDKNNNSRIAPRGCTCKVFRFWFWKSAMHATVYHSTSTTTTNLYVSMHSFLSVLKFKRIAHD